ncbi:MAG: tRNA pseudouridine(55) synthase TruB [Bdellovibrionales bacterium]|nr:tRNA pseudouridine(55) synthase TruB [Ramlibacter sp.]
MNAPRTRVQRRPVHGVLLLDKPLGLSSNDALQKAKWLLRAEKAGHTGTLDPLATGVLPLCFGAATKFSQLQLDADKTYEAILKLGIKTTTADAEGDVLSERPIHITAAQVDEVIRRFTGLIAQVPPMYSALKKDGKALYEYARDGIDVVREARHVTIYSLVLVETPADWATVAELKIRVSCSKGTYIRTLGEDIGEALGCGAHLSALRRTGTGGFEASQCVTLAALEAMTEEEREACLMPTESLLRGHIPVTLDADNAGRFLSGLRRRGNWADAAQVSVFGPQASAGQAANHALLGSAHIKAGELIPGRLLSPLEIGQLLDQQAAQQPKFHQIQESATS